MGLSDSRLQSRVEDALGWEPSVDAAHIGVTAQDGVVTLSGFVGSLAEKVAAEQAARRVKGVRAIAEEIEVRLPSAQKRSDDEIARRVLDILDWDLTIPDAAVTVKVENGIVTLGGEVGWHYQRARAEELVNRLSGVINIVNAIRIGNRLEPHDLRRKIAAALQRSAALGADQITVAVDGGQVTLGGTVRSWAERTIAEDVAWAAPGVMKVTDRIAVRS
jgi:osmotically-inducible protein OsmY